eukprot:6729071-Alexandrium_andersonii.AAC.1
MADGAMRRHWRVAAHGLQLRSKLWGNASPNSSNEGSLLVLRALKQTGPLQARYQELHIVAQLCPKPSELFQDSA